MSQSATAVMADYPGYTPGIDIVGSVTVRPKDTTTLTVSYSIKGAAAGITAGLHIHSGKSCAAASDVLGHYYSSGISTDPWTTTYTADSDGGASGSFDVVCGYDLGEVAAHAVVVHGVSSGDTSTRVACGLLYLDTSTIVTHDGFYPPTFLFNVLVCGVVLMVLGFYFFCTGEEENEIRRKNNEQAIRVRAESLDLADGEAMVLDVTTHPQTHVHKVVEKKEKNARGSGATAAHNVLPPTVTRTASSVKDRTAAFERTASDMHSVHPSVQTTPI